MALIVFGGFGPLVAAAVVTRSIGESVRGWAGKVLRWRVPARYWLFSFVFPAVAVFFASSLHILVFDGVFEPESTDVLALYPILLVQVFLIGGGNEELGWRGFALPQLQAKYSDFISSLIIGILWFLWHLPLFFVKGSSQVGVPLLYYGVAVVSLSFVFTWLYNQTDGSVLLPMVLHASVNTGGILYLSGGGAALQTELANALYAVVFLASAIAVVTVCGPERFGSYS
jgi:membrane protease YdiL (CAAX protease family)